MRHIGILLLISLSVCLSAQNTVKMSAVKGDNYGVSYTLPETEINITASTTKTIRKAGEFYQYAERYLNISNPIVKDEITYTLNDITVDLKGIPNKEQSYLVEFKSNSVAPFVTLTEDGMICAINEDVSLTREQKEVKTSATPAKQVNPKSFLSEEILRAGSTAKQAEMIAKQIYTLRETRNNILTGEADNMPPDGNAYKIVMEQLDAQEKALTSMFIGTEETEAPIYKTYSIVPDKNNISKQIIFRFSSKLGFVGSDNLAGAPVYLTLTNKETKPEIFLTDKEQKVLEKKFQSGIIYNIPAKADLKIEYDTKTLVQKVCDIVQFGSREVLTPKELEYKKDQPVKITFYPELGAIKEIKRN